MATLKCKMCGGDLVFEPDSTVCECEFCGSRQTIPTVDNEKKIKLFDRANRLRMNSEFDKAASVYESIVSEFDDEAEGYWGNLLCKYGIEYVDDPATGDKIPTCHRSSFDSIMDDSDFEMVMENADSASRAVYREQAKQIEEIRKGIIEVSGKEAPYDIFICYKETDDNGERTIDSVLAQDVYDALTEKGYRVFFSRISLEDKLGTEYEPYIFAALNSAKIMLAFGTSYDYYNAVWVKNEWSRFLKLMAKDKSKHLIPCYKNIDAYDIPKEFRALQAQDMGKIGALQDLLRGIEKLLGKNIEENPGRAEAQTVVQQVIAGGTNVAALLKRGYDSLEDGAFEEAKAFFNDALNSNAESGEAYLGLFMAEIKASDQKAAQEKYATGDYTENRYWKRAKQYASETLTETLNEWDSLRDARLRREAEAKEKAEREAREAKEEAECKAHEAQVAAVAKRKKIQALKEQLCSGNFELTAEEKAEQERQEELISSKKSQLAGLGFFKGKEKKELQAQIDMLTESLAKTRKKITEKQTEILEQLFNLLGFKFKGNVVQFGSYEQGNGVMPVEWCVLEISGKGILLITKYAIDCRKYYRTRTDITWGKCDLRKWLNSDFLNTAFNEFEQTLIADTSCPADKNPRYKTTPGSATTDKIFLLSIPEVEKYFMSTEDRIAAPTAYAKKHGAYTNGSYKTASGEACCWWLRSSGGSQDYAADVFNDGSVSYSGVDVDFANVCVRPALWINLEY